MSEIPRVCATCKHFTYYTGTEGGDGEEIPCDFVSIVCQENRWRFEPFDATEDDFRSTMLAAINCDDYELVEVEPLSLSKPQWKLDEEAHAALLAEYPEYTISIENDPQHRVEWRAWYDIGHGPTLSERFFSHGDAIAWVSKCLKAIKEGDHAVQTD